MTGQLALFDMAPIVTGRARLYCVDCEADTIDENYMVHDGVWPIAKDGGMLCVGCLEQRIGRELTARDFRDCPLNTDGPHKSRRLRARLTDARPAVHPELADKRRLDPNDGAQRLLRVLVRQGLAGEHLPAAAALCLALEQTAREEVA